MEALYSLFSYSTIMGLPWVVKGPGLVVIGLFIYRAVKNTLQLNVTSALAGLLWAFATGVLLTQYGNQFARLIT